MPRSNTTLTDLARAGFSRLSWAGEELAALGERSGVASGELIAAFRDAPDPDLALEGVLRLEQRAADLTHAALGEEVLRRRTVRVFGASEGLIDFFCRHPAQLASLGDARLELPDAEEAKRELLASVEAHDGFSGVVGENAWTALRIRYRVLLARVTAFDLEQPNPVAGLDSVARSLADLAAGALEASLAVARTEVSTKGHGLWFFPAEQVRATRFAIIGMGKAGAGELNYVSDVDVIFVAEGDEAAGLTTSTAVEIGTRLAMVTMRGIGETGLEPSLWEVDPNLRPEGKAGALVRSLESHAAYYDRWAKNWEFQALLKARPLAGDLELGDAYTSVVAPKVWSSASRENFVESVQRMRERVTEHIKSSDVEYQLKLGPGGLRDIEFTVQLLQLVHGQTDERVRQRSTLEALAALAEFGYIGRVESVEFAQDYRILRLLEHRLQLRHLRRTHLMPRDEAEQRVLARGSGLASSASELVARWSDVKVRVRSLHERLFYRPLLAAVAALSPDEQALTSEQAEARLAAIGFENPGGALAHIAAMTAGVSRRASIQRTLLPVMLQWFANGADPDYGLLAFRRLSDTLGETYWFLRMLRDSSGAAARLTQLLSGSRFVGELLERIPEAAAWLENDEELRPRPLELLLEEVAAIAARHESPDTAAMALRFARRREVLRMAISSILGMVTVEELGAALTAITTAHLRGTLSVIRQSAAPASGDGIEFAIIGMGRNGGGELGFGSDADVLYVYRPVRVDKPTAQSVAQFIVNELNRLTDDSRLPLVLDIDLRPEGKNGPAVRSLESYAAYYERWSLTWEAQALLRANGVAGDQALIDDFHALADTVRYPANISETEVREVKRIKARVEKERLPQGADPARHLKLGRGSLSDVEWLVQLLQLEHAARVPAIRTTSTLEALKAEEDAGLIGHDDARRLHDAWIFASRARSAMTLWTNKTSDVLPTDRRQLEGVARLLEYPPGSATQLEEDYLGVTRRSRAVFERLFYGG
ncbi:bifunctional [glutamine synthetase] adenylyltransferase/[glutamine synthetase]-adenylyl-L-tyrosine phosphorylase [Herbiconiux sp. KACC 21604]|uniref:bifunctional [glutamine synthetase] adenylyltransferase/[glutamine synthetase]-adenylyl-L-tyrosine phosphorylase n=1 Tax=unclassified Herbiconiux TaxID=2618217 RepID=UPI0014921B03|nr:bifunctional [glutamine synthetase] adenylyltransferase/[glutamine synthetase]-adenylyl-L-tyrosine phosphorylase [Herbiconiux sp. SALV-R1]QJU53677.1 bifunctional [glutamine synthetase] adenylyltransferase/[glutamine synthetase]-adenylyl-L-tyrosine phosphorylase [Herbiconiux sp. SALV-R1]WPO84680.1 bifunctional [glutamine synthetase] adenylyltransferase/[glutamine synthetase]-adenylyl-L-tyrosine phosphorylase [Herbiconiux sp. KACC 21604]